MNSSINTLCNNTHNLCFELILNLSYTTNPNRNHHFLRLSQNSSSYWITNTILFFFISFNFFIYILKTTFYHYHNSYENYIEIIDFTNEDEYHSLAHQQFQLRYGQRSSIKHEKPYHLYEYLNK